MKKIIVFLFFLLSGNASYANFEVVNALKEGSKLVFIRHALAPGGGDPENFNINDCSTQRNLDEAGIAQAKRIGKFSKITILQSSKFFQVSGVDAKIQPKMLLKTIKLLMP